MTSNHVLTSLEERSCSKDTKVFAFIIGINKYLATDDFATLQGAVNDAREFKQYLLDPREKRGLEVPPANIVLLENEQATRANIIATFQSHFLDNADIPDHGNATMIFYYAGHGTRIEAPDNLIAFDGKVEAISPVDERTQGADGKYVYAIPDYVLGWLLWELAAKKGRNITVILDACHSGGMGRKIGRARNAATPSPKSATSHVLLAACREDETAREIRYTDNSVRGRFTESLITWLRRVDLETTTYMDLLNRLPTWSGQTPHCGGARRDHRLFDENYPATGRRAVPIMVHTAPPAEDPDIVQTFRVDMGSVEGIVPGTEFFALGPDGSLLRALVAESVEISRSILIAKDRQPLALPEQSKAVVSDWKNDNMILHVYTPLDFPYTADLFPTDTVTPQPKGRKYVQAPTRERADIALRVTGADEIVIEGLTSAIIECQRETRLALKGNTAHLPAVLDGIAHFNYFLERHHGSTPLEGVSLKMHRLLGEFPGRKPDPDAGPAGDGNLIENHEARFPSRVGAKYGFTLCNESEEDLFPYVFYFDPNKYTISMWYAPAGAHVLAPLRSHGGTVTIGMGSERAFEFSLPPGELASSSGFLKVFVATEYLDIDWIQQISPFDEKFEGTGRLDWKREPMVHVPKWDALNVVLTMTSGE
ncbi:caspase domain-containing protein [Mycena galericulata]|nr:caspase domain-containing protein [Mycena galericulata]